MDGRYTGDPQMTLYPADGSNPDADPAYAASPSEAMREAMRREFFSRVGVGLLDKRYMEDALDAALRSALIARSRTRNG